MVKVLLVGLGGFVGSVCRYGISGAVQKWSGFSTFPFGTFTVNIVGCLVIGLLHGWAESRQLFSPESRAFLLIGLLGGFTTFSTFGYETFTLLRDNQIIPALANSGLQVIIGVLAVWLGYSLSLIGN